MTLLMATLARVVSTLKMRETVTRDIVVNIVKKHMEDEIEKLEQYVAELNDTVDSLKDELREREQYITDLENVIENAWRTVR